LIVFILSLSKGGAWLGPSKKILKMGLHPEFPVYKASCDLLAAIFRFTKEFSREYKYTVCKILKKADM